DPAARHPHPPRADPHRRDHPSPCRHRRRCRRRPGRRSPPRPRRDPEVVAGEETTPEETAPEEAPETRHGALVTRERDQEVLYTDAAGYHDLLAALRDDGFALCLDVTAVDYLTHPHRALPEGVERQRFEV